LFGTPQQFVELQLKTHRQAVLEYPFGQLAWLQGAGDREAALLHFVTSVSDAESELLRSALERRDRRK